LSTVDKTFLLGLDVIVITSRCYMQSAVMPKIH